LGEAAAACYTCGVAARFQRPVTPSNPCIAESPRLFLDQSEGFRSDALRRPARMYGGPFLLFIKTSVADLSRLSKKRLAMTS
jgi:hypothetical protein